MPCPGDEEMVLSLEYLPTLSSIIASCSPSIPPRTGWPRPINSNRGKKPFSRLASSRLALSQSAPPRPLLSRPSSHPQKLSLLGSCRSGAPCLITQLGATDQLAMPMQCQVVSSPAVLWAKPVMEELRELSGLSGCAALSAARGT